MRHWKAYIERQKSAYIDCHIPVEVMADMILVIPCYDEPDLIDTLQDLRMKDRGGMRVVVMVVINSGILASEDVRECNRKSYEQVLSFATRFNESGFCVFPILFEDLPRKHAGVGLARKIGMDLAVKHFLLNGMPQGVIVSLDADCFVSSNFLTAIGEAFACDKHLNATIHNFFHRVVESQGLPEYPVRQYESYIRYFRSMLKFIGFPYYYHTIGSAFAVTADAYVRVGGMGRQQGGEDFYFLQKVFALEHVRELNDVVVFPMARLSSRVPFGTGPSLERILQDPHGNVRAYSERAFHTLKDFFCMLDAFYEMEVMEIKTMLGRLHPALLQYLKEIDFEMIVADCKENSASPNTFRKRFFHHFNAFRIIKYLNGVHPTPFQYESFASLVDKY